MCAFRHSSFSIILWSLLVIYLHSIQIAANSFLQGGSSLILTNPSTKCSSNFSITINTTTNSLYIYQTIILSARSLVSSNPCSLRSLVLDSFYGNESIISNHFLEYVRSASLDSENSNPYATLDLNLRPNMAFYSSACVPLAESIHLKSSYLCRFMSDGVIFYIQLYSMDQQSNQKTNLSKVVMIPGYNWNDAQGIHKKNSNFTSQIVVLHQSCSAGSNNSSIIDDLDSEVSISSSSEDLSMLTGFKILLILVKSRTNGHHLSSYLESKTISSSWQVDNKSCVGLRIAFGNLVKNAKSGAALDCSEGCDVTFLFVIPNEDTIYSMQTTGIIIQKQNSSRFAFEKRSLVAPDTTNISADLSNLTNSTSNGNNFAYIKLGLILGVVVLGLFFCIPITYLLCKCGWAEYKQYLEDQKPEYIANIDGEKVVGTSEELYFKSYPTQTQPDTPHPLLTSPNQQMLESHRSSHSSELQKRIATNPIIDSHSSDELPPTRSPNSPENVASPPSEADKLAPCGKCQENGANILFEPCSHIQYCSKCAESMFFCPVCDTILQKKITIQPPKIEDYKRLLSEEAYESIRERVEAGQEWVCFSCLRAKAEQVTVPCGHVFGCNECVDQMEQCMICNEYIAERDKKEKPNPPNTKNFSEEFIISK